MSFPQVFFKGEIKESSSVDFRTWNRRKNNWLREQRGKCLAPLLGKASCTQAYDPSLVRKVLVLRNDNRLGDAVVGSSLLRGLRQLFPQATLDVVACKGTACIFRANPFVNRVWCSTEGLVSLATCGLKLRQEQYDLYIDVDEKPMLSSLVFLKCVAPKWAVGLNREKFPLYNLTVSLNPDIIHITKRYEELLRRVGFTGPFDTSYCIQLPAHVLQEAKKWVDQKFQGDDFWVFNPQGSTWKKSFTPDQILPLCKHFSHKNIVLVGAEKKLKEWLGKNALPDNVCIYSQDVMHAVAMATYAKLLFTPDTFWVHAACALHIPTVSVYNFASPAGGAYMRSTSMSWSPLEKEVKMFVYPAQQKEIPVERLIQVIEAY